MSQPCLDSLASIDPRRDRLRPGAESDPPQRATPKSAANVPGLGRLFQWVMIASVLVFGAISLAGCWWADIAVLPAPLAVRIAAPVLFLLGYFFYRWRRERRLQGLLLIVFWSLVLGLVYIPPMYIAARCPVPFRDGALARMDRALGMDVPAILNVVENFPRCKRFLDYCYDTLLVLVVIAVMIPPVCGKLTRAKEYLVAGIASAVISIPLFALLPAQGPWAYYQYAATPEQRTVEHVIVALKGPDPFVLHYFQIEGIISFPSFHTILAILAAFALWPVRFVRWPASLLAALIVISSLTTGWHYAVDILAGIAVTIACCLLAAAYTRWEARRQLNSAAAVRP
jgi:PAP2 superfamily